MNVVFLIARILFAFIFLLSAMGHLTQTEAMAGYASIRARQAASRASSARASPWALALS